MPASDGRTPRRPELSQHVLKSGALAARIVAQTGVSQQDVVVEIGSGQGALTAPLARACGTVIGVELDERLCASLRRRFQGQRNVSIVQADILRVPLPTRPYQVVGNIPFARTAEIVRRLTEAPLAPTDAYLVVQREAAHRFAGAPYAPESLVSLLLKPNWQVEIVRRFRPTDFDPAPRVHSVLLWLARRIRPLVPDAERATYRQFVESCFGRGGNSAQRCLRSVFTHVEIRRLSADLRFDPDAPPSALTFDQWLGLFRFHALR